VKNGAVKIFFDPMGSVREELGVKTFLKKDFYINFKISPLDFDEI